MKTIFTIIFSFFLISNVYASDFSWPNANELTYPEYEVQMVKDFQKSLYDAQNKKKLLDFVLNFKYDLKTHKNKTYSILVINTLAQRLEEDEHYFYNPNDTTYLKFITENETNPVYDDESIFRKLLVWVLLRYSANSDNVSKEDWDALEARRKNVLKSIIDNNKDYSLLASYILTIIDGDLTTYNSTDDKLQKKIDELQNLINQFPDSDYVPLIKTQISIQYIYGKKYDNVIQMSKEIIQKYKNFYIGDGDLYSTVYTDNLLEAYKELDKKDNIKQILGLINNKTNNYVDINNFYSNYLSK